MRLAGLTLKEIGKREGITQERVRQIALRAEWLERKQAETDIIELTEAVEDLRQAIREQIKKAVWLKHYGAFDRPLELGFWRIV